MKSLSEVRAWLKTPDHIRTILVEISGVIIGGVSSTLYLSNKSFTTTSTDTPANTTYDPCIVGGVSFSESISLDYTTNIGFGDIEIANINGERDAWLNYIFTNKTIKLYIGDPRWTKADFYLIFNGIVDDITSRDRNTLNLILLSKLERLNNPITETLLGGTGNNKDRLLPILFGECFNIEPLNTDSVPNVLEYMVHNGPIEDIIEVRDKGVPVSITKNLAQGKFTLNNTPFGQITASVQGYKPSTYSDNIATIIENIILNYGPSNSRLTSSDIDTANFTTFKSTYTDPVGYYCKDRTNILEICQNLAKSIGAALVCNSQGLVRLVRLSIPGSGTTMEVTAEDMEFNSLSMSEKPLVKGSVKLNYCKNWTVQNASSLAGVVNQNNITLFDREWLSTVSTNSTVVSDYALSTEPQEEYTYFLTSTPAATEATRRLNLWSTPRFIYTATYYAHMLPVELGDNLTITHRRFNFSTKTGIVVSIDRDWIAGRVTIGVLI